MERLHIHYKATVETCQVRRVTWTDVGEYEPLNAESIILFFWAGVFLINTHPGPRLARPLLISELPIISSFVSICVTSPHLDKRSVCYLVKTGFLPSHVWCWAVPYSVLLFPYKRWNRNSAFGSLRYCHFSMQRFGSGCVLMEARGMLLSRPLGRALKRGWNLHHH